MMDAALRDQLVEALELATAAVVAMKAALHVGDDFTVRFTGEWESRGVFTLGFALDKANAALGAAKAAL